MNAIECRGVGKTFKLYPSRSARLKELLSLRRRKLHQDFPSLRDVSFSIPKGQAVGIVGQNGSGKSTLLQLVCGVMAPSAGEVRVDGRVAALLELGAGFNPEFTGRENVLMNGALNGFDARQMEKRLPEIEAFSEIGSFIDQPVKTYSTGMFVRLAFSAAIHMDPDILVVDEALSVGDAYFQHKCFARIREFKRRGVTLLFVSHDAAALKSLCDRALLLENGVLTHDGAPDAVLDYYNALIAKKQGDAAIEQWQATGEAVATRSGDGRVRIESVTLAGERGPGSSFRVGDAVTIRCALRFHADVASPTVGILVRDRLGNNVFGTNSLHLGAKGEELLRAGRRATAAFSLPLNLGAGNYSVTVAVHAASGHVDENYDWWDRAVVFEVLPGEMPYFHGSAFLPTSFSWEDGAAVAGKAG